MRLFGVVCFFFQAEDGIRDLVRSRGLGDVYKRQPVGVDHRQGQEFIAGHPPCGLFLVGAGFDGNHV